MRNLIIFGDSLFAERISKYIIAEGKDKFVGFTQEKQFINREEINGYPVIPFENLKLVFSEDFELILGVGYSQMNTLREKIFHKCQSEGCKIATYISSNAMCYSDEIGDGNFICPGALIGPSCKIGNGNFIESCSVLSHDNQLGNYNFLSSNAIFGGGAKVEDRCFFGLNSTVKDNVSIASENLIGSASNITKSIIEQGGVYIGNPARLLPNKNSRHTKI